MHFVHHVLKPVVKHFSILAFRMLTEPLTVVRDVGCAVVSGNARQLNELKERRIVRTNSANPDVVFVWIPKTAGTSVFRMLEQKGAQKLLSTEQIRTLFKHRGAVTFGHIYVPALVKAGLVSEDFFFRSYKFTIVRNPFDRVVSLFEYLRNERLLPKTTTFDIFASYLEKQAWEDIGLENVDGLSQLNPQVKWITDASGKIFVNEIYRFEDLVHCWPIMWEKIGVNSHVPQLPALNRSRRSFTGRYFSKRSIEIIQKVYAEDFTSLGYSNELVSENES